METVPQITLHGGTECSTGWIPHHKGRYPVKLARIGSRDEEGIVRFRAITKNGTPVPLQDAFGRYVYALPGGGEFAV